jgi:hypothetical protein
MFTPGWWLNESFLPDVLLTARWFWHKVAVVFFSHFSFITSINGIELKGE